MKMNQIYVEMRYAQPIPHSIVTLPDFYHNINSNI